MFTFTQLESACEQRGYIVSIHQYDCGERVTVRWPDRTELFSSSKDCGDETTATDMVVAWMLTNHYLEDGDLPDIKPDTD